MKTKSHQNGGKKPVTMRDVARESGVSPMTVSRVLSGSQTVDPELRQRVLSIAERLDYVPNMLASNLASNRTEFIGVATPFRDLVGTTFFREVLAGFQSVTERNKLDFALFDCASERFNDPRELAAIYRQKKAGGLLIVAPQMHGRYLRTLAGMGVAFVVVGEYIDDEEVPSISCDDTMGIKLAVEHLLGLGHRDIAYIGGPPMLGSGKRRESAFTTAMAAANIEVPAHFLQPGDYTIISGHESAQFLLTSKRRHPTAIVAANDISAIGVIEAARDLGLRVPEDLSVTGFDDLSPAHEHGLFLTTLHQPVMEIGTVAAKMLLKSIENGEPLNGHVDVDVALVVRSSTGPAATRMSVVS
ncbi:MAG: LacI family DNA-binding transcriptional regulator [Chthoniobacterales bacterium]